MAIHSGRGFKADDDKENEDPEMPYNVDHAFKTPSGQIYADFEICPLEPEVAGHMQDVCIESAKNIVVER